MSPKGTRQHSQRTSGPTAGLSTTIFPAQRRQLLDTLVVIYFKILQQGVWIKHDRPRLIFVEDGGGGDTRGFIILASLSTCVFETFYIKKHFFFFLQKKFLDESSEKRLTELMPLSSRCLLRMLWLLS